MKTPLIFILGLLLGLLGYFGYTQYQKNIPMNISARENSFEPMYRENSKMDITNAREELIVNEGENNVSQNHLKKTVISNFGFALNLPENSFLEKVNDEYVRIQNYKTDNSLYKLKENEFFVDVRIFPHENGKYISKVGGCSMSVQKILKKEVADSLVSFKFGTPLSFGGEGAVSHILCFDEQTGPIGRDIFISGTSGDSGKTLIQNVLNSFEFNYSNL